LILQYIYQIYYMYVLNYKSLGCFTSFVLYSNIFFSKTVNDYKLKIERFI